MAGQMCKCGHPGVSHAKGGICLRRNCLCAKFVPADPPGAHRAELDSIDQSVATVAGWSEEKRNAGRVTPDAPREAVSGPMHECNPCPNCGYRDARKDATGVWVCDSCAHPVFLRLPEAPPAPVPLCAEPSENPSEAHTEFAPAPNAREWHLAEMEAGRAGAGIIDPYLFAQAYASAVAAAKDERICVWSNRTKLFREAYEDKTVEVMALTIQKLDLESLGDEAMRIQRDRARESAKKMIEAATQNLRQQLQQALTENEAFVAKIDRLDRDFQQSQTVHRQAEQRIAELETFADHKGGCASRAPYQGEQPLPCDCGLAALLGKEPK